MHIKQFFCFLWNFLTKITKAWKWYNKLSSSLYSTLPPTGTHLTTVITTEHLRHALQPLLWLHTITCLYYPLGPSDIFANKFVVLLFQFELRLLILWYFGLLVHLYGLWEAFLSWTSLWDEISCPLLFLCLPIIAMKIKNIIPPISLLVVHFPCELHQKSLCDLGLELELDDSHSAYYQSFILLSG